MTYRLRKSDVSEVEGRQAQEDVAAKDNNCQRYYCVGHSCQSGRKNGTERDRPGIRSCIASVTVSVVMRALSAAGSRIVPRTEDIWYLRAIQPSAYSQVSETWNGGQGYSYTPGQSTLHTPGARSPVCSSRPESTTRGLDMRGFWIPLGRWESCKCSLVLAASSSRVSTVPFPLVSCHSIWQCTDGAWS